MPKGDTIIDILKRCPSADPSFLTEFSEEQLRAYLGRLTDVGDEPMAEIESEALIGA